MMSKEELKRKAAKLAEKYSKDISSDDPLQEMNHITMVHNANFDSWVNWNCKMLWQSTD